MCVYADETGLKFWNSKKDPMPINIANGKSLKDCLVETNPIYDIYCDGGTQIRMGYTGLGQKYIDTLNTIYSEETARGYDITAKTHPTSYINFHISLIDILNQEHIEEVERNHTQLLNVRNVLEEQPIAPVLAEQRIFIAINFALYVDKENKALYIGEGFENLLYSLNKNRVDSQGVQVISNNEIKKITNQEGYNFYRGGNYLNFQPGKYFVSAKLKGNFTSAYVRLFRPQFYKTKNNEFGIGANSTIDQQGFASEVELNKDTISGFVDIAHSTPSSSVPLQFGFGKSEVNFSECQENEILIIENEMVVKTSTPKPFVKSMFPGGKLAFLTNATSETHSFILKNIEFEKIRSAGNWVMENGELLWVSLTESNLNTPYNLYYSKNYKSKDVLIAQVNPNTPVGTLFLTKGASTMFNSKISQLLIYENDERGGMTETELKAELAKDIRLK